MKWEFPGIQAAEKVGWGGSIGTQFQSNRLKSLVREILQNSLDNPLDKDQPVRVEFSLEYIKRENLPDMDGLLKAIQNVWKTGTHATRTDIKIREASEIASREKIPVMKIADFNTTGMEGTDSDQEHEQMDTPFHNYLKTDGSNTTAGTGGSFGLGKADPYELNHASYFCLNNA